jgi:hypothetical protein
MAGHHRYLKRHALAKNERYTWNELARHPLVINTASGSTRVDLWDPAHRPEKVVECDNYDEWIALIAADRGVGATAMSAASANTPAGVTFIALDEAPPASLRLAWLPSRTAALTRRFIEAAAGHSRPR